MSQVPPVDLAQQYQNLRTELDTAVLEVLASGRYIGGSPVEGFEQQFANYLHIPECVACNSGTDALYLALRALEIGPGDEVITSPFTFIATTEVISAIGAVPIFVDIDIRTFNLDVEQVEAAITEKTRAIIPVHLFGQAVDMTRLMEIAQAHHLAVIEDCAQATGAEWAGQPVGTIGHVGCFSFFPTKNLGACGDGGAITTRDPAIADRVRMLREHGSRQRYLHEEIGVNSRLDAVQAVILQVKLRHLPAWNEQRRTIAERYTEFLSHIPGLMVPYEHPEGRSVWNQYTIRLQPNGAEGGADPAYRDRVRSDLQKQGVIAMVYYALPLHLQPVYRSLGYAAGSFPATEEAAHQVLSLPMFPDLSIEQQDQVIDSLKDCLVQNQ
ncbi:MAG: DegT/DnrJ/EryC1/StrS family aminotransferase [Leptolyngbyaceae cyanobacterium bins.59]|nr:DegT/DnrJ/EryC1/StrS family aminotransferase [Leptolyngbyaceae cyanobacterium bins.59]